MNIDIAAGSSLHANETTMDISELDIDNDECQNMQSTSLNNLAVGIHGSTHGPINQAIHFPTHVKTPIRPLTNNVITSTTDISEIQTDSSPADIAKWDMLNEEIKLLKENYEEFAESSPLLIDKIKLLPIELKTTRIGNYIPILFECFRI